MPMKTMETNYILSRIKNKHNSPSIIKQTRWIFWLLGLWPMMTTHSTKLQRHLSIIVHCLCQIFLNIVVLPALFYLFFIETNQKIKIALYAPIGVALGCVLKCGAIVYRLREIKMCIEQIEKDWIYIQCEEDHEIMIRNMKFGKKITTLCAVFMYTGGVSHQIMAPFLPGTITSTVHNSTRRMLVYPVYDSLFDSQATPIYQILYVTHIITGIVTCTVTISVCHLSIFFITHLSGQNQIILLQLKNLTSNQGYRIKQPVHQKIRRIINYYVKVLVFSSCVEKCLRELYLIEIIQALFTICNIEYYALTAWKKNEVIGVVIYIILIATFILNCFIFCYVGEISKTEFQKTGEAVYMTEWYHLPYKDARALILIIAITQNSPRITAGGIMELSYSGFIFIMKTTAAYFNILRRVD